MADEAELKKKIKQLETESKKLQKVADKTTESYKQQVRDLKASTKEIKKAIDLSKLNSDIDAATQAATLKEMLKTKKV